MAHLHLLLGQDRELCKIQFLNFNQAVNQSINLKTLLKSVSMIV